jgi:hypothetical protein
VSLVGTVLFSTYFPSLNDMILVVSVGITSVYFMGEVDDTSAVDLINSTKENGIPLEMIKLN